MLNSYLVLVTKEYINGQGYYSVQVDDHEMNTMYADSMVTDLNTLIRWAIGDHKLADKYNTKAIIWEYCKVEEEEDRHKTVYQMMTVPPAY